MTRQRLRSTAHPVLFHSTTPRSIHRSRCGHSKSLDAVKRPVSIVNSGRRSTQRVSRAFCVRTRLPTSAGCLRVSWCFSESSRSVPCTIHPSKKLVMPRLPRVFGGPASHSVLRGRLSGAFLAPKGACYAMEFIDAHYRFKVATSGLLCMHSRAGALKPVGLSSFVWIRVTGSLADADLFCALDEKTPSTKPCEFVLCAGRLTSAMASLHESDPIVPLILILKDDLHVDVTPLA